MLSRWTQILIKRAQMEAHIDDADYREAVETVSALPGCRSSKDARLTDRHVDLLLAYFEAIHWRGVDAGAFQPSCKANAVFRQRGYWASKNPQGNTSRDRFADADLRGLVEQLEAELLTLGVGPAYLQGIQNRIEPFSLAYYRAALNRTIKARRRRLASA